MMLHDRLRLLGGVAAGVGILLVPGLAAQIPRDFPVDRRGLQFRADVELVRLSVTARYGNGAIVHDLEPEEFQVLEDGVEQEVAHFGQHETPISVVVLLDKSGSMAGDKLMHAKDAVVNFTRALNPHDEVLVMAFSEAIDVLGGFGLNAATIERAIKKIRIESSTRLYDALIEGSRAIVPPERKEKRAILILSDGEDTASRVKIGEAVEAVKGAAVPVYAIGIEMDDEGGWGLSERDPLWRRLSGSSALDALRRLTDGTGGWTYPVQAAKRCKEICLRVADELRNQYLLGYYPTNPARDGRWRTITVRTTRPGVTLVTRGGYYAPASS